MKAKQMSPTMTRALDFAKKHGGKLLRSPGGFWAPEGVRLGYESFGTLTVQALVDRGAMVYSEWRDGRNGRFPVAAEVAA